MIPRRLRRGAGPERGEPAGRRRGGAASVVFPLKVWRESHAMRAARSRYSPVPSRRGRRTWARSSMGRNMFGAGAGPWGEDHWRPAVGLTIPLPRPRIRLDRHQERCRSRWRETPPSFGQRGVSNRPSNRARAFSGRCGRLGGSAGANAIQQYLSAGLWSTSWRFGPRPRFLVRGAAFDNPYGPTSSSSSLRAGGGRGRDPRSYRVAGAELTKEERCWRCHHAADGRVPLRGGPFEVSEASRTGRSTAYCTRCQHRTGTAFSVSALTGAGLVQDARGEELVRSWQPPDGWGKALCWECGSHLFSTSLR